jgi:hypothetical protein
MHQRRFAHTPRSIYADRQWLRRFRVLDEISERFGIDLILQLIIFTVLISEGACGDID